MQLQYESRTVCVCVCVCVWVGRCGGRLCWMRKKQLVERRGEDVLLLLWVLSAGDANGSHALVCQ